MNGIEQIANKVSELYEKLFGKRYIEVTPQGRKPWKNVWV